MTQNLATRRQELIGRFRTVFFRRGAAPLATALAMLGACTDNVGIAIVRRPPGGNVDSTPLSSSCMTSGIASIRDNFDARTELGPRWTMSSDSAPVLLIDGQIVFRVPQNRVNNAGVIGTDRRSLRDCAAHLELTAVPDADHNSTAFFVVNDSVNYLAMFIENNEIRFLAFVAGRSKGQSRTYDPAADRWLRFREKDGVALFQTSSDGQAWTVNMEQPAPAFVNDVHIDFYLYSSSTEPGPHVTTFDNVNVLP